MGHHLLKERWFISLTPHTLMRLHGNAICCSMLQARFMIPLEVHNIGLGYPHWLFYTSQGQAFPASNWSLSNLWMNHTLFYYLISSGANVCVWTEGSHPFVPNWSDTFKWLLRKWLLSACAHLEGKVVKRRGCVLFPLHHHLLMLHVHSGSLENN